MLKKVNSLDMKETSGGLIKKAYKLFRGRGFKYTDKNTGKTKWTKNLYEAILNDKDTKLNAICIDGTYEFFNGYRENGTPIIYGISGDKIQITENNSQN